QLVCDDLKYIRFANFGWPGSVTDSTAYKSTPLFNNANKFFSKDEYLLADCGYQLTPTTIIPYKQPQASISENTFFNEILAKERVKIEHVNGILKGRFGCLNGIRTQIISKKNLKFVLDTIKATIILYNLALNNNDIWEEILIETNLNLINSESLIDRNLNEAGKKMRKNIQNI
ncbi:10464_t:CDS:1, partial [Dentiscutata erythropus]